MVISDKKEILQGSNLVQCQSHTERILTLELDQYREARTRDPAAIHDRSEVIVYNFVYSTMTLIAGIECE